MLEEVKVDQEKVTLGNKEALYKSLDLIQDVIKRMAQNEFWLKGWSVSLILLSLWLVKFNFSKGIEFVLGCGLIVVVVTFWYLSAFFLNVERIYRKWYDYNLKHQCDLSYTWNIAYILNLSEIVKILNINSPVCKVFFSKTLLIFYGVLILWISFLTIFLIC